MTRQSIDIAKAVETITIWPPGEQQYKAANELLQYLSENLPVPVPFSPEAQCAIVVDSGNECLLEIFQYFLPPELQGKTTLRHCERLSGVVNLMQTAPPALLVIHSNLLIIPGAEVISALVAVSSGTRYLVMTGWEAFLNDLRRVSECLHVHIDTILLPCRREEFETALRKAIQD